MRLVLLSDTHCGQEGLAVPACDVLVHAGDFTRHGTREEAEPFFRWLGAQPARARVLVAGNHDFIAERDPGAILALAREHGVTYLADEGAEVLGLKVWGSPRSPRHGEWAFQYDRGEPARALWNRIPARLDVLITHGPPRGLGDLIVKGERVGCADLLEAVRARPPGLHVFGHVHEAHGESRLADLPTRFVNASNFVSVSVRRAQSLAVRPGVVVDL